MLKNEVKFAIQPGGLGRLPLGTDHVSAIVWTFTDVPKAWGTAKGKLYKSVDEAEADDIVNTDAALAELWYHITEFFRITGIGEIYVVQKTGLTAQIFHDITEGRVHQVAWQNANTTIATEITAIKTFSDGLEDLFAPVSVITHVNEGTSTFTSIKTANAPKVSVICYGENSGYAATLMTDLSVDYVPALGTTLGCIALARVHENIGWPRKFPLSTKYNFSRVILSDGTAVTLKTDTQLQAIADAGYIFGRKLAGLPGFFVYDTFTAVPDTSDYNYIERNRVVDKAKREIRAALIPDLMRPLYVDEEGKLSADTIAYFQALTEGAVSKMAANGEVSAFRVIIDPEQDVLTTSKLVITVKIVPAGTAREIVINIGYTVNLNA